MPIPFQPKPRTVVYCDFSGYIPPEMIKRRPVVVLAAHKRNAKLVAVVPLSTTRPNPVEEHHFQLLQNPLADSEMKEVWAKCDMVAVVSTKRLELIPTGRRLSNGQREYVTSKIGQDQFDAIRKGVALALGLTSLFARTQGNPHAHETVVAET